MSAKLDRFKNIKGFLHPDEGKFLYELSLRECRERFAVELRLAPIAVNLPAILV